MGISLNALNDMVPTKQKKKVYTEKDNDYLRHTPIARLERMGTGSGKSNGTKKKK